MERQKECVPQPDLDQPNKHYRPFLLVILFISLFLTYLILRPFMHTLIFSIVLASCLYPLQVLLVKLYGGKRKTLGALTIVFVTVFLIALPVFYFLSALVSQGIDTVNTITEWIKAGNLQQLMTDPRVIAVNEWVREKLPFIELEKVDISGLLLQGTKNVGQFILGKGATILGNAVTLISHLFVMIFVIFYLVRDGEEMVEKGRYFSPLLRDQEDRILHGVRMVARSVLLGSFLTAVLQGLVGSIALAIVGIPALFWGTMIGFSSLIPVIGTAIIWVPVVGYLLLMGYVKSAVFFALWSIVVVGSIDNFIRPFLMKGQANMSPFYIFLSIVGGVQYFGLVGILYGPLILSFAMIMLYIYGVEYQHDLLAGGKTMPAGCEVEEKEG